MYDQASARLSVIKTYASGDPWGDGEDSEDGDGDIEDETAEEQAAELRALQEEAELPIEELRKRFGDGDGEPAAKRAK